MPSPRRNIGPCRLQWKLLSGKITPKSESATAVTLTTDPLAAILSVNNTFGRDLTNRWNKKDTKTKPMPSSSSSAAAAASNISPTQDFATSRSLQERRSISRHAGVSTGNRWQLHVSHRETDIVDVYLIHPEMVARGPRRSIFFANWMNSSLDNKSKPNNNRVITLELSSTDATLVPSVLDYIYYNSKPIELPSTAMFAFSDSDSESIYIDGDDDDDDDDNQFDDDDYVPTVSDWKNRDEHVIRAIYKLAYTLEIVNLKMEIAENYIQQELFSIRNAFQILQLAKECSDSKTSKTTVESTTLLQPQNNPLLAITMDWCVEHLYEFEPQQARDIEPSTVLELLHRNKELCLQGIFPHPGRIDDFTRSQFVVQNIMKHGYPSRMTLEQLYDLTDETLIPFVSANLEAPEFLLAETRLLQQKLTMQEQEGQQNQLSSLQSRCIQSITTYWRQFLNKYLRAQQSSSLSKNTTSADIVSFKRSAMLEYFQKLPAPVLAEMIASTTSHDHMVLPSQSVSPTFSSDSEDCATRNREDAMTMSNLENLPDDGKVETCECRDDLSTSTSTTVSESTGTGSHAIFRSLEPSSFAVSKPSRQDLAIQLGDIVYSQFLIHFEDEDAEASDASSSSDNEDDEDIIDDSYLESIFQSYKNKMKQEVMSTTTQNIKIGPSAQPTTNISRVVGPIKRERIEL